MTAVGWCGQAYEWANNDGWACEDYTSIDLDHYQAKYNYLETLAEDELIQSISDIWGLRIEEVFVLTDKQQSEFIDKMASGDIGGLTYLSEIVNASDKATEELKCLLDSVMALNFMNDCVETRDWNSYLEHESYITNLYRYMRSEVFNKINVSEEDVWEV